jgi:hypothetical protein
MNHKLLHLNFPRICGLGKWNVKISICSSSPLRGIVVKGSIALGSALSLGENYFVKHKLREHFKILYKLVEKCTLVYSLLVSFYAKLQTIRQFHSFESKSWFFSFFVFLTQVTKFDVYKLIVLNLRHYSLKVKFPYHSFIKTS